LIALISAYIILAELVLVRVSLQLREADNLRVQAVKGVKSVEEPPQEVEAVA
jgi:hypothetical protein